MIATLWKMQRIERAHVKLKNAREFLMAASVRQAPLR